MERNTLSIVAKNQPGTLVKVATLISGRGLNIHELTARVMEDTEFTVIDVDFLGEAEKLRQVRTQLGKLEVVREVTLISAEQE